MNNITQLFKTKKNKILNLFCTAGYPYLNATNDIIIVLQNSHCDIIEIGIPFSDPLSDGPIIQASSNIALQNGMSIAILFKQLASLEKKPNTPIILMGYLNPVMQFGIENFLKYCKEVGVAGTILPDLPINIYEQKYEAIFKKHGIENIFLVTPETTDERIKKIDALSNSFIYVLSSSATTGGSIDLENQKVFFNKLKKMKLKNPYLIGFGIKTKQSMEQAFEHANGAIIGSAFVQSLQNADAKNIKQKVQSFLKTLA